MDTLEQVQSEIAEHKKRKPSFRVGDVVFADGSWFLVTEKNGQRCRGRLLTNGSQEYGFRSRGVERVFRELGRRA